MFELEANNLTDENGGEGWSEGWSEATARARCHLSLDHS